MCVKSSFFLVRLRSDCSILETISSSSFSELGITRRRNRLRSLGRAHGFLHEGEFRERVLPRVGSSRVDSVVEKQRRRGACARAIDRVHEDDDHALSSPLPIERPIFNRIPKFNSGIYLIHLVLDFYYTNFAALQLSRIFSRISRSSLLGFLVAKVAR